MTNPTSRTTTARHRRPSHRRAVDRSVAELRVALDDWAIFTAESRRMARRIRAARTERAAR